MRISRRHAAADDFADSTMGLMILRNAERTREEKPIDVYTSLAHSAAICFSPSCIFGRQSCCSHADGLAASRRVGFMPPAESLMGASCHFSGISSSPPAPRARFRRAFRQRAISMGFAFTRGRPMPALCNANGASDQTAGETHVKTR